MVSIDDRIKKTQVRLQVTEVLMMNGDGHYDNMMPVQEICGLLSQYNDDELQEVIDELAVDPATPIEYGNDNHGLILTSKLEAITFYNHLEKKLPFP